MSGIFLPASLRIPAKRTPQNAPGGKKSHPNVLPYQPLFVTASSQRYTSPLERIKLIVTSIMHAFPTFRNC